MRFCRRTSILLSMAAAFALLSPGPVRAWGPNGHDYIATVARELLNDRNMAVEARFQALLRNDSIAFTGNDSKTGNRTTCHGRDLREIASWPDCIRRLRQQQSTGAFHFDDVPLCGDVPPAPPPLPAYCEEGKCATEALKGFIATLSDHHGSRQRRARALAWIIHIVGDLHQPLHDVDNGNDRGGNLVSLTLAGDAFGARHFSSDNLHSLWDTPMVFAAVGEGQDAVDAVRALANQHLTDWRESDSRQWVIRAHAIAVTAYNTLPAPPACGAGAARGGRVTSAYVANLADEVREQLAKGAIRLADIVEAALS